MTGLRTHTLRAAVGRAAALLFACAAARGGTIRLTYDDAGRLTGADYGGARAVAWRYDGAGNVLTQQSAGASSAADLAVLASASPAAIELGRANLVYTLAVTNTGPTDCPVLELTNAIPASTLFARASAGTVSNGVFRYSRSDLAVGAVALIEIEVVPLSAGSVVGAASVAAASDPDPQNNGAACTNLVTAVVDADHNGLPDWWEQQYIPNPADRVGSLDLDGDGIPNAAEGRAGTDPRSATSALRITALALRAGAVSVTFPAVPGHTYRMQAGGSVGGSGWSGVVDPVPGRAADLTLDDASAVTSRFYRIEVTHPPAP